MLAEKAKAIINVFQSQGRWGLKCTDSLAVNVFYAYVRNAWRDARAHRSAKRLLVKRKYM